MNRKLFTILLISSIILIIVPVHSQTPSITEFLSVPAGPQTGVFTYPSTHNFQWFFASGDNYISGPGSAKEKNDFTAYIPINNRSDLGYVCINHETFPGGVSILKVYYDSLHAIWRIIDSRQANLQLPGGTGANCSGTVTSWNTMISCEEFAPNIDLNFDGYEDYGWCFEVDPVTASAPAYNTGSQQKLWALGNMAHENVVIAADNKTVYFGEDGNTNCIYKFIADQPGNLYSGTLFSLQLDDAFIGGEPTGTTGIWQMIPNTTKQQRNDVNTVASAYGCNDFGGVEDVEINPISGYIYFASKLNGRVYRFKDDGSTISNFEVYAGGMDYAITTSSGINTVAWGSGNDNLAFDTLGNLWVMQDGGDNYIWLVSAGHTQQQPLVSIFGIMPIGSEPTGITMTPDNRFIFMSIQHPAGNNNPQINATGNMVTFNRSASLIIARKEILEFRNNFPGVFSPSITIQPNPVQSYFNLNNLPEINSEFTITFYNLNGQIVAIQGGLRIDSLTAISVPVLADGLYICELKSGPVLARIKFSVSQEKL
jgi:secreted PhoX family phosphatase